MHSQGWVAAGRASGVKMYQISCTDHADVATPDKGSKPKKEREYNSQYYIEKKYMNICIYTVHLFL